MVSGKSLIMMVCMTRFGSLPAKGQVSGQTYDIRNTGTWVREEDAPGLLTVTKSYYCTRRCQTETVQPFALKVPQQTKPLEE